MGKVNQERQDGSQDHMLRGVSNESWRKVRMMAAAFDLPISAIIEQAIDSLADKLKDEVSKTLERR